MRVLWTDKAIDRLQRLQQVHDYLGQDQPHRLRFVERITNVAAETIGKDPGAGRPIGYIPGEDIREVRDGTCRIVYRILPDEIHILTVRHTHRVLSGRLIQAP
jgi:plasmid stabilization system protein ParE